MKINNIDKEINELSKIKKQHFDSSLPLIDKCDDIYRNIFSVFATLSATIGAFSFLLNDKYSTNNTSLIIGDTLLLIVITFSIFKYIKIAKNNHIETLNYYRKFQNKIDKCIDDCNALKKGEININEYNNRRKKINEDTRTSINNTELKLPNYFTHTVVLIFFIYAIIFIGLSLINPK